MRGQSWRRSAWGEAVQAPELLEDLFRRGTELLIRHLPSVFDGCAQQQATPQVSKLLWHPLSAALSGCYCMGCSGIRTEVVLVEAAGTCLLLRIRGLVGPSEQGGRP